MLNFLYRDEIKDKNEIIKFINFNFYLHFYFAFVERIIFTYTLYGGT